MSVRVTAIGITQKPKIKPADVREYSPEPKFFRQVYFDEWINTSVYDRRVLRSGVKIEGPAVIEDYDTTLVIPLGYTAFVDGYGNIRIQRDLDQINV